MDTSFRMLDDGNGNYYDVKTYSRTDDPSVASALGVPSGNSTYRRIYQGLLFESVMTPSNKYHTTDIVPCRILRRRTDVLGAHALGHREDGSVSGGEGESQPGALGADEAAPERGGVAQHDVRGWLRHTVRVTGMRH
jgi:hypothetical protein